MNFLESNELFCLVLAIYQIINNLDVEADYIPGTSSREEKLLQLELTAGRFFNDELQKAYLGKFTLQELIKSLEVFYALNK